MCHRGLYDYKYASHTPRGGWRWVRLNHISINNINKDNDND